MNIQQMMKQAQLMQQRMEELQDHLAETEVEGRAAGGLVQVVMTCKGEVRKLSIDPQIINPADRETLEDTIMAALNAARAVADKRLTDETQAMMDELGMPANMKLPF